MDHENPCCGAPTGKTIFAFTSASPTKAIRQTIAGASSPRGSNTLNLVVVNPTIREWAFLRLM
jgi:hypothetical protein